jgi:hypothetical protein
LELGADEAAAVESHESESSPKFECCIFAVLSLLRERERHFGETAQFANG